MLRIWSLGVAATLAVACSGAHQSTPAGHRLPANEKSPEPAGSRRNTPPSPPEKKQILAVFEIQARGVRFPRGLLSIFSEYLATRISESGAYDVVPNSQVKKLLVEKKKSSYQQCYDQKCQIEIGRELAACKSLATKILRIGKKCVVTGNLFDLRKSVAEKGVSAEGGCTEAEIMRSLKVITHKLTGMQPPTATAAPTPRAVAMDWLNRVREQSDAWRAEIQVSCLDRDKRCGRVTFRALSCGGDLVFKGKHEGGFLFLEQIRFGRCVKGCFLWLNKTGTWYKEICNGKVAGKGILE